MTGPSTKSLAAWTRPNSLPATWRGSRLVGKILMGLAVLVLIILFLYPPLLMVMAAFRRGQLAGQGEWTLQPFLDTITSPVTWVVTWNSIVLSLVVAILGLAFGTFLAWVAVRTRTPMRRWMTPIMAVTLVIPSLFYGLGWYVTLAPPKAPVNQALQGIFGLGPGDAPVSSGWGTLIFVVVGHVIPIAYLFMVGPMSRMDAALDDAARMSGATRGSAFFTVTLPLLRPSMLGVLALMTTYGMSAFELPLLFGLPSGIHVFSTKVLNTINESEDLPNYAGASTLALILVLLVVLLVALRERFVGNRRYSTITGKGFRPEPKSYGRWQWAFLAVFVLVVLWSGVIPLVQMILGSFEYIAGVASLGFTTGNYEEVLTGRRTFQALTFTLGIAAIGGFLAAAVALLLSHTAVRSGRFVRVVAMLVSWAPVAIPGVLVGLALLTAYMPIPGLQKLIGTPVMLVLGFIVVATPIATRAVEGGVLQLSAELEESARISGASRATTFFTVVFPLVLPSFLAGWFIAGIGIAGNLSLPVLLSTPTMRTAAVTAYDLYNQGRTGESAALFLLLMLAVAVVGGLAWLVSLGVIRLLKRTRVSRIERAMSMKGSVLHA